MSLSVRFSKLSAGLGQFAQDPAHSGFAGILLRDTFKAAGAWLSWGQAGEGPRPSAQLLSLAARPANGPGLGPQQSWFLFILPPA